ncbi:MAG: SURF1-like protein [Porticoccaceae bacterium]|nr:MAG: SURF1-like protein [Porticoccaceae bacterium]
MNERTAGGEATERRGVPALLLLAAVAVPLCIGLGFWQLAREGQKRDLLAEVERRLSAPPCSLEALEAIEDWRFRRVRVVGRFDERFTVLLENRVRHGRPGYEVVTLFHPAGSARPLWVNRGWLPGGLDRARLPAVPPVSGRVAITGYLYRPNRPAFRLGPETWRAHWPQVFQHLDFAALEQHTGIAALPWELRLEPGSPGALEASWPVVTIAPERHRAYAVQWFSLAALVLVGVLAATSPRRWRWAGRNNRA